MGSLSKRVNCRYFSGPSLGAGFSFEARGRTFRPVVHYAMSGTLVSYNYLQISLFVCYFSTWSCVGAVSLISENCLWGKERSLKKLVPSWLVIKRPRSVEQILSLSHWSNTTPLSLFWLWLSTATWFNLINEVQWRIYLLSSLQVWWWLYYAWIFKWIFCGDLHPY